MTKSELINDILSEWAYRVDDGQPNPKNPKHIDELSIVLSEMGLGEIKHDLIESITEADKQFTNPILNKEIPYKAKDGTTKKGIVGNLLRLPEDHPGRIAAEKMLPPDAKGKEDAMKDLGSEKDGHSTIPQPKKEPKEEPTDKKDGEDDKGAANAEKEKQVQAMFQDPAYKAARLDKEKEVQAKIANQDIDKGEDGGTFGSSEKQKPSEETADFKPVEPDEVQKEMPQASAAAFNNDSDIENISPEERHSISTKIDELSKMADEAKAKGEKAPNYNLCDITLPDTNLYCDDNLGIPRDQMPQFKGKPQPGSPAEKMPKDKNGEVDTEEVFKKMLADKGIKTIDTEIPSDSLKASQSELVGAKVAGMTKALEEDPNNPGITAPIYVSRDGYVIDGHHRWAAVTSKAIKDGKPANMKVHVIDMDAKDIIPMANKFAQDIGVAAKSADTGAGTVPSHKEIEKQSEVRTFKGETSGKEIKSIEFGDGAQIFGVEHGDTKMVDDIVNKVKSTIPKEKWKDIVFLGEGGASDENGEMQFNDEVVHAADEFKKMGATIDSFDGDDMDVHNDQSNLYKMQKEKTGLSDTQIKAGNWASMIGQGEGTDTMSPDDYLDDDGKQFLQDAAEEAGLPQIENWENPTDEDKDTLYRLSFPTDNGDKETKVNDIQVAFNEARDENLLDKTKKLKAQGKIPITIAGEGHIDLLNKKEPKDTSIPTPKPANETPGGVVYNVGGNYYSDTPDGPAQYIKTESVLEKILIEGDESYLDFLFEANVIKKTSKGTTVKLKTIDLKNQKKATLVAKAKKVQTTKPAKEKTPATGKDKTGDINKLIDTGLNNDKINRVAKGFLTSDERKKFEEFKSDVVKFYSAKTDAQKQKIAADMIAKYKLSPSPNKEKMYLGYISKHEGSKILGTNIFVKKLLDDLTNANGGEIGDEASNAVSQALTTAAKPDLIDKVTAKADPFVANLFENEPLSYLNKKFQEVHGPVTKDGKLIGPAGGANAKEYFKHSITRNKALDNTIELAKQLEKEGKIKPGLTKALKQHKAEMFKILKDMKVPSKEASQAVGDSYATLAQTIAQTEDEKITGAIMKQFAEMALYDTETAGGDECYLPSQGNFPSGDKIKITRKGAKKVEKVQSISVKYGLKNGFYGFPGETAQYQIYHPNPAYRDRNNSHPGDTGYLVGVKDSMIDNDVEFDKMIEESGFAPIIKDTKKFKQLIRNFKKEIDTLRKKYGVQKFVELIPHLKEIKGINEKYASQMANLLKTDAMPDMFGPDNSKTLLGGPMAFVTAMSFAGTIRTSGGLKGVWHNHQNVTKEGKFYTHTTEGSPDLKEWKMNFRAYEGRGGGMTASYNQERRNPEYFQKKAKVKK